MTAIHGYEIHPAAEIFPMIGRDGLADLAKDIQENGLREPIVKWGEDGPIIDGRNRIEACAIAGVSPHETAASPEITGDPIKYVLSLNLHRRHLNESQRAMVAARIANMQQGARTDIAPIGATSQDDAAESLKVGRRSVQRARKVAEHGTPELAAEVDAGRLPVSVASQAVDLIDDPEELHEAIQTNSVREAVKEKKAHVANNTGDFEWYTPAAIVESARSVMGGIDLDPSSCEAANEIVQADRFYTIEDDALAQEWRADRLWMNPPYASGVIGRFAQKLRLHVEQGDVVECCVIVNNGTETRWFLDLFAIADAICFPTRRVKFWSPDPKGSAPLQGQAIIYHGPRAGQFVDEFSAHGCASKWGDR